MIRMYFRVEFEDECLKHCNHCWFTNEEEAVEYAKSQLDYSEYSKSIHIFSIVKYYEWERD